MDNLVSDLERSALEHSPPGAVVIGVSVSPNGALAATLTLLPSAGWIMTDLWMWTPNGWRWDGGDASQDGSWWRRTEEAIGVLLLRGGVPPGATTAVVGYGSGLSRVQVRHGYFLFAAWNASPIRGREVPAVVLGYE